MPGLGQLLERRFARNLRSWPRAVGKDVVAYLGKSRHETADRQDRALTGATTGQDRGERFWSLLPRWLFDDPRFAPTGRDRRRLLNDILWAQYCLFLFVRIHDDLFDGQARSPSLLFVADQLLVESETTFAKHFPDAAFWRLFRQSLNTTLQGILKVDALQQHPSSMNGRALRLYADVSAIFKVGAAAVCVGSGRMGEFRLLSRFSDEIAIVEQILDDLLDVEEDLARARYNFAANELLAGAPADADRRAERLARTVLLGDGVGVLLKRVRKHLDRADAAIAPLRLAPAAAYVDTFRRGVDGFGQHVHQARVAHVFQGLKEMQGALAAANR
jgi:hypothetical protein